MVAKPAPTPTYRPPPNAISSLSARPSKTSSTMSSPPSTIPRTAEPMPEHSRWNGRASPCRAGPMGKADGAADSLATSAARGRELARLLDPDAPVPGVTQGALRPGIAVLAVPSTTDSRNMTGDDFALTAGWGHFATGDAVMPGQGRLVEPRLHPGRTRRAGRCPTCARRKDAGRVPERPRLLAQRARRDLGLQTRRLPSPQKMAILPRTRCVGTDVDAGGSAVLCGSDAEGWGDIEIDTIP